jgi:hypothetical protein
MLTRRTFLRTMLWLPPALLLGSSCSGATPGVNAKLDYDLPPPLGGIMTFRLTATSAWDAPNPTAVEPRRPRLRSISPCKMGW